MIVSLKLTSTSLLLPKIYSPLPLCCLPVYDQKCNIVVKNLLNIHLGNSRRSLKPGVLIGSIVNARESVLKFNKPKHLFNFTSLVVIRID